MLSQLMPPIRPMVFIASSLSFQKSFDPPQLLPAVRVIAHGQIQPVGFFQHAAVVGKGVEALLPVIAAHAAVPHAAEGQPGVGQVHDGIVEYGNKLLDLLRPTKYHALIEKTAKEIISLYDRCAEFGNLPSYERMSEESKVIADFMKEAE